MTGTQTTAALGGNNGSPGVTVATEEIWNGSSWTEVNDLNTGRRNLSAGTSTAAYSKGTSVGTNW